MNDTFTIEDDGIEELSRILMRRRSKDFYEFIAFVCWYVFLIICCVIPTACAYRRRRNAERLANASISSQLAQANFHSPGGVNNGVVNELRINDDDDDDLSLISPVFAHAIRRRRELAKQKYIEAKRRSLALKMSATKMVVSSNDLVEIKGAENESDIENGNEDSPNITKCNSEHLCHFYLDEVPFSLNLPVYNESGIKMINGGPRSVADTCAICLCQYEEGDNIVWSGNKECQHVFHEDCILTWLVKKEEPLCPFCTKPFVISDER